MEKHGITETPPNPHRKGPPDPAAQYRRDGEGAGPDGPAKMSPSPGRIRIVCIPNRSEPLRMREELVGLVIVLPTPAEHPANSPLVSLQMAYGKCRGYVVFKSAVVAALYGAGKHKAAEWWEELVSDQYLEFDRDVCEEVP